MQFKFGKSLVKEKTRRTNSFVLIECLFVDDDALVCMFLSRGYANMFDKVATEYGLH